jgi:endonuclease-3
MRTSRISRDTKIISTLAASRTRRPLRQIPSHTNPTIRDFALNAAEARRVARGTGYESESAHDHVLRASVSDSELSSVPEDSGSDGEVKKSRKRKRGQNALPITTGVKSGSKEISISAIASPKKGNGIAKKARRAPVKKSATRKTGTHGLYCSRKTDMVSKASL